jgi:uncharacterized damage-inducible protein DinB
MSNLDSKDLLAYSQALRNRYLKQIASLPWEEVVKSRGASFDSLRNILLHTLDAEDRLVNYVILGSMKDWVSRNPDEFRAIDAIRKRAKEVESKTKTYVTKIEPAELERRVELTKAGMPSMRSQSIVVRVEDILVHAEHTPFWGTDCPPLAN